MKKLPVKKADIILAAFLCLAAFLLLLAGGIQGRYQDALWVRGYLDGKCVCEYPIDCDIKTTIRTPDQNGSNVLVIDQKKVYIASADCPGQDCVKMGMITKSGEELICLPHKLVIRIEGGDNAIDAISQ